MSLKPFLPALTLYHISRDLDLTRLEEQLTELRFTPCGPQDLSRCGFVPALHDDAETLSYISQGHLHLRIVKEEKKVPPSEVNRLLEAKVKEVEAEQGRNLVKKERQQFKEEIFTSLLPRAFPRKSTVRLWIDLKAKTLAVGTASENLSDLATALLRKALGSLPVVPFAPRNRMGALMVSWLQEDTPPQHGFTLGAGIALKSDRASQLSARNVDLMGYQPIQVAAAQPDHEASAIALNWRNTMGLTLTDGLVVNHIGLGGEFCDMPQRDDDPVASVAANAELATGLLRDFIADLRALIDDESRPPKEASTITAEQVTQLLVLHHEQQVTGRALLKSDVMLRMGIGFTELEDMIQMANAELKAEREQLQLGLPAELDDPLLADAKHYILTSRRASVSSLQREFKIGYNRAGRIMERLEVLGVVSSPNSSGARDVLMPVPRPTLQGEAS